MVFDDLQTYLKSKQYTWVVTGVAGFIGSNILEFLLLNNQRVIGIDNFMTGTQENLDVVKNIVGSECYNNHIFYEIDIRNQEECEKVFFGADFILHQAALGSVPRSIDFPEMTNSVNVDGFISILNAARKNNINKVVYASSSAVYGDSALLPKVEDIIGSPLSPYAVSKLANELYAGTFSKCYGMSLSGLRYFNVYGPRQNPKGPYAAVVPIWINSLLSSKACYINGKGETSRDFTYIQNVIQANILAALKMGSKTHKVYNVGAGHQTSLNDLYRMISTSLNSNEKVQYREYRMGDVHHSLANIDRIKADLNYNPMCDLEKGIKLTCEKYLLAYR